MESPHTDESAEKSDSGEHSKTSGDERKILEDKLRDIFADRRFFLKSEGREAGVAPSLNIEHLSPEELQTLASNIRILSFLNGHRGAMLRRLAGEIESPEGKHLAALFDWSSREAQSAEPDLGEIAKISPPEFIAACSDADDLFERLSFAKKHDGVNAENYSEQVIQTTAKAIGLEKSATKWIDLVQPVYQSKNSEITFAKLFDEVGFIPRELSTKRKFKGLGAKTLVADIHALRSLEDIGHRDIARFERARMANQLFMSGSALELQIPDLNQVTLDVNGVFISAKNLYTHIPYGLLNPALPEILVRDNWISQAKAEEASLRMLEENSEFSNLEAARDVQVVEFAKSRGSLEQDPARAAEFVCESIVANPDWCAGEVLQHGLVIPDRVVERLLAEKNPAQIYAAIAFAEAIGRRISGERLERHPSLFTDYGMFRNVEEANVARSKILNESQYYDATKVARAFLEEPPASDPKKKFFALRGMYKKSREGDQHSFVEVVHNGKTARVLVNEEKQLSTLERKNLEELPLFDREQYEHLEFALKAFNGFCDTVAAIEKDPYGENQEAYDELFESAMAFVTTNTSEDYLHLRRNHASVTRDSYPDENIPFRYQAILTMLKTARDTYGKFLYANIDNPEAFVERFSPDIRKRDINFGQEALDDIEKNCTPDGYDSEQCLNSPPIRVVEIHYKAADPTKGIPIHIEEECLDALRMYRDRPLVNVVGGARLLDPQNAEKDFSNIFAASVLRSAHRQVANIAVPGMQSGIGNAFGSENIHYRNAFAHLPHADQAHVFAISPGGNTYYPGNSFERGPKEEQFAIAPVDSIITPFQAGWELRGVARLNSPYFKHIAYMESLYDRISHGEPRVTVVANGGLYSIAEINESIKKGFPLLLVKDTGRFAEIASALAPHLSELNAEVVHGNFPITKIEEILEQYENRKAVEEFLLKDFGTEKIRKEVSQQRSDEFMVYRSFFREFIFYAAAHPEQIKVTTIANVERDLDGYLKTAESGRKD